MANDAIITWNLQAVQVPRRRVIRGHESARHCGRRTHAVSCSLTPSWFDREGTKLRDERPYGRKTGHGQEHGGVRALYVGIPAALVYPLGVLGVGIQVWRDPLFPYARLDTVWTAVALVPEKTVIGTGITLLFFALMSTAFAIGVSVLVVRGLLLRGRNPSGVSEVGKAGPRRWTLLLLLLIPLAVVVTWISVRVDNATELAFFIGFFAFSAAAGFAIGYVRWRSDVEDFYWTMLAVYAGGIAAAVCLAATQTPQLPLVEITAERKEPVPCQEVPVDNLFVMLDRSDSYLSLYNMEGMLSLPESEADIVRFRECQEYLDRH